MNSFRKNGIENNEAVECLTNVEFLEISKNELDNLLASSENLKNLYQLILEKYMAFNIRHYQKISSSNPKEKLIYFNEIFPSLKNRINDTILSTFLILSRSTLLRTREDLNKK